jgi:antitoxin (DNA-binding transcriptional repressor) of toxin-antitoxin stability system
LRLVTVRDMRLNPGKIWDLLRDEKEIVLTANGRPVAILTGVNEESLEEELEAIRRAKALRALDRIHRKAGIKGSDRITDEEIEAEIEAVRKG